MTPFPMPRRAALALTLAAACAAHLSAQAAPAPSVWEPTLVRSGMFDNPTPVEGTVWRTIVTSRQQAPWLRLYFSNVRLDGQSYLRMVSLLDGEVMTMRHEHLDQWEYSSAYFNGNAVMLELVAGPNSTGNFVELTRFLAGDEDPSSQPQETICGTSDDRTPSTDVRVGRIDGIGCTGWIINTTGVDKAHLSAGHCAATNQVLSFAVPASNSNCGKNFPSPSLQFAVDYAGSVRVNGGVGNDFWVFRCFPNPNTGLTTWETQGSAFTLATSMPAVSTTTRVTGFGLDGTTANNASGGNASCSCSSTSGTGARNQTQQTETGPVTTFSGTTARYQVDTCGGNSGSPVIDNTTGFAFAIHTHGGCSNPLGSTTNAGTQITHPDLQAAIDTLGSGCARYIPEVSPNGGGNTIPFGSTAPDGLSTIFTGGNGGSSGGAIYFDATFNADTHWTGVELNSDATAGTKVTIDVYLRNGTYVGNTTSMSGWTARTAGHGTSAGPNSPTRIFFNEPILVFGPITHGVSIVARNFGHDYTDGNGSNQAYSDANVSLSLGAASNVPFSASTFSPRVANMTLHYNTDTSTWTNQLYQTVLRRSELLTAGPISNIAFSANNEMRHFNRQLRIRMSHVPAGHVLSTTFANNMPNPVTVLDRYNYNWYTLADNWSELGFAVPFNYNGTSDVVVEIYARGNTSNAFDASTTRNDFNSSTLQERVFDYGWAWSTPPATGTYGASSGLRMRVNYNCATFTEYGSSCGPLTTAYFGTPNRGGTAWYDLENAPANSGVVLAMGFGITQFPTSLTQYGFTNCNTYHDLTVTLFKFTNASGTTFHGFSVPNNPA